LPKIFISYRRDDTDGEAGHLFQGLRDRFGETNVFMDVTGVQAGADFRSATEHATKDCDVFLPVIGNEWLTCRNPDGKRRLDDPEDLVRAEVATALRLNKLIVPVLVENAGMPKASDLPKDIEALAWRNAVEIRHLHWDQDLNELVAKLTGAAGRKLPRKVFLAPAVVGLGLIAFLGWRLAAAPAKCHEVCALVADFLGPDSLYRVTDKVMAELNKATRGEKDVRILALRRPISEKDGSAFARAEGRRRNATMVIWGWYTANDVGAHLNAYFELLRSPKYMPTLARLEGTRTQNRDVADLEWTIDVAWLKRDTLQTVLSKQLSYLTLFTLGMLRYAVDDWQGAIRWFSAALDQMEGQVPTPEQSLLYYKRGLSYFATGDSLRAVADYNRAIELNPTSADALVGRGLLRSQAGDLDAALVDFDQAIKIDPANALAYNNRAGIRFDKKEFGRAIDDYNRAIELKPDDPAFYEHRARTYHASGDYDRAIADYGRAMQLKPDESVRYSEGAFDSARVLRERGASYFAKGDNERAIADYGQAIRLKPDSSLAYHERGRAYEASGEYQRAILDFTEAIKRAPDDFSAYNNRGNAYKAKGDFERAIADYDRALAIDSTYVLAYNNRGIAYVEQGQLDRAITDYNQAIRLAPADPFPYNDRGFAYFKQRDYDRAIADYDKALKLKPDYSLAAGNREAALRAKASRTDVTP